MATIDGSPSSEDRFLPRWEVGDVAGAVVAVDVLRAFTTAAYAFGAGARHIFLVATIDEALRFRREHPGSLVMGEDGGRRAPGFDLSNSPVEAASADLAGRVLVQRTGAGTQGVVAARCATRLWCASLVCASATAAAVRASGLGDPTYVITGRSPDAPRGAGDDDLLVARLIERARRGHPLDAEATVEALADSDEAARTLALGGTDSHPDDVTYASALDRFDFAMEVSRTPEGLRLAPVRP